MPRNCSPGCSWRVGSPWRSVPFHAYDTLGTLLVSSPLRRPSLSVPAWRRSSLAADADRGQVNAKQVKLEESVDKDVRFATFNASLNRNSAGQLVADLSTPDNAQASLIAETIQRVNPDVLLINEFDFYPDGQAAELFRDNYLAVPHNGAPGVEYPYYFVAPSNTGIPSGFDLNNNGGRRGARRRLRVRVLPGAVRPGRLQQVPDPGTTTCGPSSTSSGRTCRARCCPTTPLRLRPQDWYSPAELDVFRLSSKSHWDVPISIGNKTVHFLVSHPTPPVFDGPEDRNGTRNHDEIRFWADYVTGGADGVVHLRRRRRHRRARARRALRDRRRPELRPARRRLHPRFDPAAARQRPRSTPPRRPTSDGAVEADHAAGPREPDARVSAAVRHGRLRRHRPRQPAGRLRPAEPRSWGSSTRPCSGRLTADPLFRLTARLPHAAHRPPDGLGRRAPQPLACLTVLRRPPARGGLRPAGPRPERPRRLRRDRDGAGRADGPRPRVRDRHVRGAAGRPRVRRHRGRPGARLARRGTGASPAPTRCAGCTARSTRWPTCGSTSSR